MANYSLAAEEKRAEKSREKRRAESRTEKRSRAEQRRGVQKMDSTHTHTPPNQFRTAKPENNNHNKDVRITSLMLS